MADADGCGPFEQREHPYVRKTGVVSVAESYVGTNLRGESEPRDDLVQVVFAVLGRLCGEATRRTAKVIDKVRRKISRIQIV